MIVDYRLIIHFTWNMSNWTNDDDFVYSSYYLYAAIQFKIPFKTKIILKKYIFLINKYVHHLCIASSRIWPFYPHPYGTYLLPGGCNSKRKGGQVRFTPQQTQSLERRFHSHKYLSPEDRRHLAVQLKLSDRQVNNTRQQHKNISSKYFPGNQFHSQHVIDNTHIYTYFGTSQCWIYHTLPRQFKAQSKCLIIVIDMYIWWSGVLFFLVAVFLVYCQLKYSWGVYICDVSISPSLCISKDECCWKRLKLLRYDQTMCRT